MAKEIQCEIHENRHEAFVCSHLVGESAGLGFNRDEPAEDNPFPDACCDDCEIIRLAHGGWTAETEELMGICLICSGCYELALIRHSRPALTLNDLNDLRWKCGSCDEWHSGPCLDFSTNAPYYWRKEHEASSLLNPSTNLLECPTFLDQEYCAIEGRDFFVRGIIFLPIIGTSEHFCWGVWGSLSRENFQTIFKFSEKSNRVELPPMFSWMSSQLAEYPETLGLKMSVRLSNPRSYPTFELERSDHPLAQEFYNGISVERVKEIMLEHLEMSE